MKRLLSGKETPVGPILSHSDSIFSRKHWGM